MWRTRGWYNERQQVRICLKNSWSFRFLSLWYMDLSFHSFSTVSYLHDDRDTLHSCTHRTRIPSFSQIFLEFWYIFQKYRRWFSLECIGLNHTKRITRGGRREFSPDLAPGSIQPFLSGRTNARNPPTENEYYHILLKGEGDWIGWKGKDRSLTDDYTADQKDRHLAADVEQHPKG